MRALTLLLSVALGACGESPAIDDASVDDGGIDGSQTPVDASDDAGTDAAIDTPPRQVSNALFIAESGPSSHSVMVRITTDDEACTAERIAGCDVESCPASPNRAPTIGTATFTSGARTVTLMPMADGAYADVRDSGRLFATGDLVRFQAAGGDFAGAFDRTLAAPPSVTLAETSPLEIARDAPFELAWTADGPGTVMLAISYNEGTSSVAIRCTSDASAGRTIVPPAVLARTANASGGTGRVLVFGDHRRVLAEGLREVRVIARTTAVIRQATFR